MKTASEPKPRVNRTILSVRESAAIGYCHCQSFKLKTVILAVKDGVGVGSLNKIGERIKLSIMLSTNSIEMPKLKID